MNRTAQAKAEQDALDVGADHAPFLRDRSEVVPEGLVQQVPGEGALKEVIAIVRPRMAGPTKEALLREGFPSVTAIPVVGRGRQGGLAYPEAGRSGVPYLPKCLLTLLVPEGDVGRAIAAVLRANRTGEIGDGKIFVAPLHDVQRIRTGERGPEAIGW